MAESRKYDILLDWVNEDIDKRLAEAVDKFQKHEKEKKNTFLCRKWLKLEQSQSAPQNETQIFTWLYRTRRVLALTWDALFDGKVSFDDSM